MPQNTDKFACSPDSQTRSSAIANIANRFITAFMLLLAVIAFQNVTTENTEQVLKIRIEQQENKTINIYTNSDTSVKKSVF